MEEKDHMSFEDFIKMFIAVNYIRGNVIFNINTFQDFIFYKYSKDIKNRLDIFLPKLIDDGILYQDKDFDCNWCINNQISLEELIKDKVSYLQDVFQVVLEYENYLQNMMNRCYENLDDNLILKKIISDFKKS